jgi:ubiquinone/menaquinone biosynthesis C-methylase UbiE
MRHENSVQQSFGSQAREYLKSEVHSQGADLELLKALVAQSQPAAILDLGCGAGHASFALAPLAREVLAYDLLDAMLSVVASEAQERQLANIRTEQGSVERLPFPDARFDWVVSRFSAHHWRNVGQALAEVRRVLKPGGQVCFIDTVGGPEPLFDTYFQALEVLRDPSHVRNYTGREWLDLFHEASLPAKVIERGRTRLEFASWVKRIGTAPDRVAAIKSLWAAAPAEVREYYAVHDDLSFEIDVTAFHATT